MKTSNKLLLGAYLFLIICLLFLAVGSRSAADKLLKGNVQSNTETTLYDESVNSVWDSVFTQIS